MPTYGDWTETQVTEEFAYSVDLAFRNQEGWALSPPTEDLRVTLGSISARISFIGWIGIPSPRFFFRRQLSVTNFPTVSQTFSMVASTAVAPASPAHPWDITGTFTATVEAQNIWRRAGLDAQGGRDTGPAYAIDNIYEDAWTSSASTVWSASFAGMSMSGISTGAWSFQVPYVEHYFAMHKGSSTIIYAEIDNETLDGASFDYSRFHSSGIWYYDGQSGGIQVWPSIDRGAPTITNTIRLSPPYIADYSEFSIRNREGTLQETPLINGPLQASNHVPDSLNWAKNPDGTGAAVVGSQVYPTVSQLRNTQYIETAGRITGMDYRDATDDQYDLLTSNVHEYTITNASAQAEPLRDDDILLPLRIPGVDKEGCDEDPDWTGLNIAHRDNVGIYGPSDVLAHSDWTGSGGVPTADAAGAFTVSGDGSLTLTLPCGYETRLNDVPGDSAPEAIPRLYWTRKAEHYVADDGVHEAVWCWLGWCYLDIPITAPGTDTLTLTVNARTYTYNDNHRPATRAANFSYTTADTAHTYTIDVSSGAQTVQVCLVTPNSGSYPYIERVVSVELTGFDNGAWVIGEPVLVLESGVSDNVAMKTFEGHEYLGGGASAHVDAAPDGLYAGDGNLSHDTNVERVVPMFDFQQTEGGTDNTTAWELADWAEILDRVSDAWTVMANSANINAATKAGGNTLEDGRSFWHAHENPDSATVPLEDTVVGGNCAIRGRSWAMARGVKYMVRPDKIYGGRAHGLALSGTTTLLPDATQVATIYKRGPGGGGWSTVATVDSDEHGHWGSGDLPEVYDYLGPGGTARPWEYGINTAIGVDSIGAAYDREYITAATEPEITPETPWLVDGHVSDKYLFYGDSDDGHVYCRRKPSASDSWETAVVAAENAGHPCAIQEQSGRLLLIYERTGSNLASIRTSDDLGATWSDAGVSIAGKYPAIVGATGVQFTVAYTSNVGQVVRRTQSYHSTLLTYTGGATSALITADTDAAGAAFIKAEGEGRPLVVAVPSGNVINMFRSIDDGENWTQES